MKKHINGKRDKRFGKRIPRDGILISTIVTENAVKEIYLLRNGATLTYSRSK